MIYSGNKSTSRAPYSLSKMHENIMPSSRGQFSLPAISKIMNKREEDSYKERMKNIVKRKSLYSSSDEQFRINSPPKTKRSINIKDISAVNLKLKQRLFNV